MSLSPIRAAARDGRLEEVKRILEEVLEGRDYYWDAMYPKHGWTAIQWAAVRGRTDVVLYLLKVGGQEADWNFETVELDEEMIREAHEGTRALDARQHDEYYDIDYMMDERNVDPVWLASLRGHEATVRALLEARTDCWEYDMAIKVAVLGGYAGALSALLEAVVNV